MLPRKSLPALFAAALLLASTDAVMAKAGAHNAKVDRFVQESLDAGGATQHVIITLRPGFRDALRKSMTEHGDSIKSEHPLIDALAVELHSGDIDEIANQPWVVAVSADAFVYAKAETRRSGDTTNDTQAPQIVQTVGYSLRDTLGLPASLPATISRAASPASTTSPRAAGRRCRLTTTATARTSPA
jgi:hypothetical protein